MNWLPFIVGDEYEVYNTLKTLKNKYNRGGEEYIYFTTFYRLNRHLGENDGEELSILVRAANKFQHLVKL
jgi:hypothetical protein